MHLLALRGQRHDDVASLLLRCVFHSAQVGDLLGETLQHLHTADRAGLLTSAKHDGDLDLVACVEETLNVALLDFEVVVVDLEAETNLLDFRGALVASRFALLDLLVVLELAVIDQLGNRRLRIGRHLDEIEVRFLCQVQCDGSRDDSHLLAVRADQTHLGDANLVVNAWFVADDDSNPHIPCNGTSFDWQFSKVSIVQGMPKRITTRRKPVRAAYISHRDDRWKASA